MKYDQLCLRFTFAEFSTNVMCKVIVFFNNTSLEIYLSSFGIRFEQLCEQIILKAILIKVSMKVIPVKMCWCSCQFPTLFSPFQRKSQIGSCNTHTYKRNDILQSAIFWKHLSSDLRTLYVIHLIFYSEAENKLKHVCLSSKLIIWNTQGVPQ